MYKEIEMIGKKFGILTVISKSGVSKSGEIKWLCRCECGKERLINGYHLRNRNPKYCCCNINRSKKEKGEVGFNILYNMYKSNAKKYNREFLLSKEEFKNITSHNCHYCNCEPNQFITQRHIKLRKETIEYSKYTYNGIDRKDNSIGYILINSLPCCNKCNIMKGTLNYSKFLELISRIYVNRIK